MGNEIDERPPVYGTGDGFSEADANNRVIQGSIIRCVDGRWLDRDGLPIPLELT